MGYITAGVIALGFLCAGSYFLYQYVMFSVYGKSGQAVVISYDGERRSGRRNRRTVYEHTLSYDEGVMKKSFSRQYAPGTNLDVIYVPGASMLELHDSAPELVMPGIMGALALIFCYVSYTKVRDNGPAY